MSVNSAALLLDELRAIAQLGLHYASNPYDVERYKRLLDIAVTQYSTISGLDSDIIRQRFANDLGYVTPKTGVSAAVFADDGKLLLVQRTDDNTWCLPGGWAEIGESPQQSVAREVLEETGLIVEVKDLVGLHSRMPGDFDLPNTSYHLQFYCEVVGGEINTSVETKAVGFYHIAEVPQWHLDHNNEATQAVDFWEKTVRPAERK